MKRKSILVFIGCVAGCEAAGAIGSVFTAPSIPTWYAGLAKPALSPPNWVFAPVWTALFALMGVSLALLILTPRTTALGRAAGKALGFLRIAHWGGSEAGDKRSAYVFFAVQLILNVLWSALFFGLRQPQAAFFGLIALWVAILATIYFSGFVNRAASWLLVPYILWVTFAGYLNFSLWRGNLEPPAQASAIESSLPLGYSRLNYDVAEITGASCRRAGDCETPMGYLLRSSCPYASVCLAGRCAVVCPKRDAR